MEVLVVNETGPKASSVIEERAAGGTSVAMEICSSYSIVSMEVIVKGVMFVIVLAVRGVTVLTVIGVTVANVLT